METAIVFIHGVNAHLELPKQEAAWRNALARGGNQMNEVRSTFAYYSDWFFKHPAEEEELMLTEAFSTTSKKSERDQKLEDEVERLADQIADSKTPDEMEQLKRAASEWSNDPSKESLSDFDISTFFPASLVKKLIRRMVFQLYDYFDNTALVHPRSGEKANARTLIRSKFRSAVSDARDAVGEGGKVIVLAHSMGSVVAWDCLQHDKRCGKIDGFITFGSPLALDFVQRELAKIAGANYSRSFPQKLEGHWHNLVANFDKIATLDSSFEEVFAADKPNSLTTTRMSNPDFRWAVRPSTRLTSAHSSSGYLRSMAMASALEGFNLSRNSSNQEVANGHTSANAERLAAQRYRAHKESRQRNKARLAAQESVLGIEVDERVVNKLNQQGIAHSAATKMVADAHANPAGRVMLERVLGTPDFIQSSYALRMAAMTSSVGQVLIGQVANGQPTGFASGFLISPRLMMTNNHVLPDEATAAGSTVRFDYAKNIDDRDLPGEEFGLRPEIFFITSADSDLDYSIVAVDEPEGGLGRPWSRLIEGSGKILLGQAVNIIQHPRGRRQELITRNSTLTFIDEKPDYAHYSGDTEPGSSGSPCYNDRWELAFLHHASVPNTDSQGNYLKKNNQIWRPGDDPADIDWIANEGIRISRIVADVKRQGLTPQRATLFEECLEDPELDRFLNVGLKSSSQSNFTDEADSSGQITRRYSDGRVSYLFEVSFGLYGGAEASTAVPSKQDRPERGSAKTSPFVHSPGNTGNKTSVDTLLERSIIDLVERASQREPYFDADRDAEDAKKYYEEIKYKTGQVRMYGEYSKLIASTHTKVFGYDSARLKVLYPYVDLHQDGTLRSIYSGALMRTPDVIMEEALIIMDQLPNARETFSNIGIDGLLALADGIEFKTPAMERVDVPYNCEHVVPQSWYEKRKPMVSDLHHLFTCERGCNSYRGKRPYGDFEGYDPEPQTIDLIEAELRAKCGLVEARPDGRLEFEPENNKGAVARATLYFLLRYQNEVGNAPSEMPLESVKTLLRWHSAEPVTDYERHRNRAIFLTQGNRNPFIDFPELAEKLAFRESFE